MNKLNSKFYDYLAAHPNFGPVVPLSHNRYKVSCRTCEESFNNPRVHVLKKHLESAKHAARRAVRSGLGLTKKETVQRDKLISIFPFLRFIAPYLVCMYCDLVFSCGASPSMIANHEKCRKHQDLKAEYQLKLEAAAKMVAQREFAEKINDENRFTQANVPIYPGVIYFSTKDGQVFKLTSNSKEQHSL